MHDLKDKRAGKVIGATLGAGVLATSLGLGSAALAQATPPQSLTALGLSEITLSHEDRNEQTWHALAPSGVRVEVETREGEIEEIESLTRNGFTLQDVAQMLPEALLNDANLPQDMMLESVEVDREIEIEGWTAQNVEIEATYTLDGALRKFERDG